jgi:hypothetical protein
MTALDRYFMLVRSKNEVVTWHSHGAVKASVWQMQRLHGPTTRFALAMASYRSCILGASRRCGRTGALMGVPAATLSQAGCKAGNRALIGGAFVPSIKDSEIVAAWLVVGHRAPAITA